MKAIIFCIYIIHHLIFLHGNLTVGMRSKNKDKYLILNYFKLNQENLEISIKDFSRKRDLYRTETHNFTQISFYFGCLQTIADYANLTLVTSKYALKNLKQSELSKSSFVNPVAWGIPNAPYTLINLTRMYQNKPRRLKLSIVQIPGLGLNFGYCDKQSFRNSQSWFVQVLTSPLEKETWISLLLAIILTILAYSCIYKSSYKLYLAVSYYIVCSLFANSLTDFSHMSKSVLLYVWLLFSYVVSFYYAATVTSEIIIPTKEHSWDNLGDMVDQNYSLIVRSEVVLKFLKAAAYSDFKSKVQMSKTQADITSLAKLTDKFNYDKAVFLNTSSKSQALKKLVQEVAYRPKAFTVDTWPTVISIINLAIKLLEENPRLETKVRIRCHLGKRLQKQKKMFTQRTVTQKKWILAGYQDKRWSQVYLCIGGRKQFNFDILKEFRIELWLLVQLNFSTVWMDNQWMDLSLVVILLRYFFFG